jgi:hypothetical protein
MSFETLLADVSASHKQLVVYAPDPAGTDLGERLATRNLSVEHRWIPTLGSDAFVVIRDAEGFHGAISLSDLLEFLVPPIRHPSDLHTLSDADRAVYDLLDNTVFVSLDRRQLLATSRELEDRAWRTGRGRLHVGFQQTDAYEAQADLYRELAETTDIDVHLYLPPEVPPPESQSLTVHTEPAAIIERYWFILFDDGRDGSQNCALVAKSVGERRYRGVWTYDPELVSKGFEQVE